LKHRGTEEAEEVRKGSALTDMRAIILITKSNLSTGARETSEIAKIE